MHLFKYAAEAQIKQRKNSSENPDFSNGEKGRMYSPLGGGRMIMAAPRCSILFSKIVGNFPTLIGSKRLTVGDK